MPLRQRLGFAAATAVAIAIVLVSLVSYLVVKSQLRGQIDSELQAQGQLAEREGVNNAVEPYQQAQTYQIPSLPASAGGPAPYLQIVWPSGVYHTEAGSVLPITSRILALANGHGSAYLSDVTVGRSHLREFAVPVAVPLADGVESPTGAVLLARPLYSVDHILSAFRLILLLLCAAGIGLAAMLGRLAANRVLSPLAEVAQAAEHIGETEDLSTRIIVRADDEVGQLAARFNTMLDRLESSRDALDHSARAQRQLVADASHELRTPVTSLRTNVEVLLEGGVLSDDDRQRLLADVVEQTEELGALVNDLIELARGDQPIESAESFRLDGLVEDALDRARRNAPSFTFEATMIPVIVEGIPERLLRAINNLLDNATRHARSGTTIEVLVGSAGVRIRDHGDGLDPRDIPHVFDRFYRGVNSRGRQGSGLGLAIVRQVAEQHGGSVKASNAPDGGAIFEIRLPTTPYVPPRTPALV